MGAEDDKNGGGASKHDYDVTEHLMSAADVSAKYATDINAESPSKSGGLKSSEVRQSELFSTPGTASVVAY